MGAVLAKDTVAKVAADLMDPTYKFWSKSDLLGFYNAAARLICLQKPEAYSVTTSYALVAGAKQGLPDGGNKFAAARRNLGVDGETPGPVIRYHEAEYLTMIDRDWMSAPGAQVIQIVTNFDKQDPKAWYCYPQAAEDGEGALPHVELVYYADPPGATINGVDGAGADTAQVLDDIYLPAVEDYMRFRALMREGEQRSPNKAMGYLQSFMAAIGNKVTVDKQYMASLAAEPTQTNRSQQ